MRLAGELVKPGVTTDEIDEHVHRMCIERGAYPSPLNYQKFPKSVCTSVNEVICHGIPDSRELQDGDIVNLDVTCYLDGVHGDTNATFAVGTISDEDRHLIRVTEECMWLGIETVKPDVPLSEIGRAIEAHARKHRMGVVRSFIGHGIGEQFHTDIQVLHYYEPRNNTLMRPGMTFTIEPMITLGSEKHRMWDDEWTAVTVDGRRTAQFEHTVLVTDTSTLARLLQTLLSRWPEHPRVELVTTDGFLYSNAELTARGILDRKGFPESYDTRRLLEFLRAVKSGEPEVSAPVYSHVIYDVLPDTQVTVHQPDILILEGLNVLQVDSRANEFVSDYFDFSIYLDADESLIEDWFVERFHLLRRTVFQDPNSFFRHFAELNDDQATALARQIWETINGRNLRENIAPTKGRASLVIEKGRDHRVTDVFLRKL
ncbi:MAG: type I pantothenate kinase [Actinobacteria bacterium]|nr:type I pantothenate kinase [Actinomycetota bacterium]